MKCVGLFMAVAVMAAPFAAAAGEPVRLEVASTFPSKMAVLGDVYRDLPMEVSRTSAGTLELVFREPNALVPIADTVRAVSEGRMAAAWAGAGWFAEGDSAYNLFSTVPFGPGMGEYMA